MDTESASKLNPIENHRSENKEETPFLESFTTDEWNEADELFAQHHHSLCGKVSEDRIKEGLDHSLSCYDLLNEESPWAQHPLVQYGAENSRPDFEEIDPDFLEEYNNDETEGDVGVNSTQLYFLKFGNPDTKPSKERKESFEDRDASDRGKKGSSRLRLVREDGGTAVIERDELETLRARSLSLRPSLAPPIHAHLEPSLEKKKASCLFLKSGFRYWQAKRYHEAIIRFKKALHVQQNQAIGHIVIGLCYLGLGNEHKAIKRFKFALRMGGITEEEKNSLYFELGQAHEHLNQVDQANYYYEILEKRDPNFRIDNQRFNYGRKLRKKAMNRYRIFLYLPISRKKPRDPYDKACLSASVKKNGGRNHFDAKGLPFQADT